VDKEPTHPEQYHLIVEDPGRKHNGLTLPSGSRRVAGSRHWFAIPILALILFLLSLRAFRYTHGLSLLSLSLPDLGVPVVAFPLSLVVIGFVHHFSLPCVGCT
jgi:hypothetical protein